MRIVYAKPFSLFARLSRFLFYSFIHPFPFTTCMSLCAVCLPASLFILFLFHISMAVSIWKAYHSAKHSIYTWPTIHIFEIFFIIQLALLHHPPPPPPAPSLYIRILKRRKDKPNTLESVCTNSINLLHHILLHIVRCTYYKHIHPNTLYIIPLINAHSPFSVINTGYVM